MGEGLRRVGEGRCHPCRTTLAARQPAVIVRTWRQYGLVVEITASVSLTRCGASLSTARGSGTSPACRSATRGPMLGWFGTLSMPWPARRPPFFKPYSKCGPAADGLGRLQEAWRSSTFSLRCPFNEERDCSLKRPDVDNGLRTMQQASVDAPTNGNREGTPTPTVVS